MATRRLELGFEGGTFLRLTVEEAVATEMTEALTNGRGTQWREIAAEEGTYFIDQHGPASAQVLQGRLDVGDREGDVVEPLAALGHEAGDGALGVERADQLDGASSALAHHRLHALRGHRLAHRHLEGKRPAQLGDRRVEVRDHVAHVVDGTEGGAHVTGSRRPLGRSSRPTLAQGTPFTRTTSAV